MINYNLKLGMERDSIDLGRIDSNKQLSHAESLLEFFIISLARNLQLKPKQVILLIEF